MALSYDMLIPIIEGGMRAASRIAETRSMARSDEAKAKLEQIRLDAEQKKDDEYMPDRIRDSLRFRATRKEQRESGPAWARETKEVEVFDEEEYQRRVREAGWDPATYRRLPRQSVQEGGTGGATEAGEAGMSDPQAAGEPAPDQAPTFDQLPDVGAAQPEAAAADQAPAPQTPVREKAQNLGPFRAAPDGSLTYLDPEDQQVISVDPGTANAAMAFSVASASGPGAISAAMRERAKRKVDEAHDLVSEMSRAGASKKQIAEALGSSFEATPAETATVFMDHMRLPGYAARKIMDEFYEQTSKDIASSKGAAKRADPRNAVEVLQDTAEQDFKFRMFFGASSEVLPALWNGDAKAAGAATDNLRSMAMDMEQMKREASKALSWHTKGPKPVGEPQTAPMTAHAAVELLDSGDPIRWDEIAVSQNPDDLRVLIAVLDGRIKDTMDVSKAMEELTQQHLEEHRINPLLVAGDHEAHRASVEDAAVNDRGFAKKYPPMFVSALRQAAIDSGVQWATSKKLGEAWLAAMQMPPGEEQDAALRDFTATTNALGDSGKRWINAVIQATSKKGG